MIRIYITVILFVCLTMSAWATEKGPLRVRNQFPPHLMFLTPLPDSPRLMQRNQLSVSLSADYASVFVNAESEDWTALMDTEMTVLDVSFEYGVTEYLTLSLEVPLISMNDGFLDGFLEDYHNMLGVPNYGRENRPKNEFAYVLQKEGQDWFKSESGGCHPGDSSVSLKIPLADEKEPFLPWSLSLSYTLKIPTGDEDHGFGSGGFDHGVFLFSQFNLSPFVLYLNPGFIFLTDPETSGPEISVNNIFALLIAGEYIFNDQWTLSAQFNYYTSPFENTGIRSLDDDSLELAVGFTRELTSAMTLEFAFCEDLSRSEPDFNVHTRLIYRLGN
ncbi:DUF3187 family protein [Desulfonema magnum]|uniref:DUF3187 n=1 Tax=Desulfonema magnum TaxID=45655 RepID=A0A975BVZ2_9BACT|nr:DUF3187 family protein [Desulfonema magnum]QTA92766.1 DUF3187 [Desulfonema magnum]